MTGRIEILSDSRALYFAEARCHKAVAFCPIFVSLQHSLQDENTLASVARHVVC